MTGFDIIVLLIVGLGAVRGFMRGFVQEVLSLAAWGAAIVAIYYLHTDLTAFLFPYLESPSAAAVLAFALLLLIPYAAMRVLANWAGRTSRASVLGPIDRVLGFGFGTIKGAIIVVMCFSLVVLIYDTIWGENGRPEWIVTARTYPFVNASTDELVHIIDERQELLDYGAGNDKGETDFF
ncbi:CvpA family protein [Altericroceibacterium spongiae]|uniref:CvpA family protein n=1 Tax=Altericroceibacterium spongiae TaxID=2320269 RepID=A0A420ERX6_9SPHN|nr:CvpA family protein [Altericroceibacterium spongiae]RKF23476.1 CvpA family protein [Altericroceibacterium spongiae]